MPDLGKPYVAWGGDGEGRHTVWLTECTCYVPQPDGPAKQFRLAEPQDLRILASVLPYDIIGGGA